MEANLYHYKAVIVSVYDGDTCTAVIDLGFKFYHNGIKLRLTGIDAPESRGETLEAGRASRDYLKELVLDKRSSSFNRKRFDWKVRKIPCNNIYKTRRWLLRLCKRSIGCSRTRCL